MICVYEVWCDGYDGYDKSHSYWFSKCAAVSTAERQNRERPNKLFRWEVITHAVSDLPMNKGKLIAAQR